MMLVALQEHLQEHASEAGEKFDAGKTIIEHVSNSGLDHPLIHLPKIAGIDFSVTKHVLMLWLVSGFVFLVLAWTARRYAGQRAGVPTRFGAAIEFVVEWIRDSIVLPNVGKKWVNTWTPLVLTFFFFILCANAVGLIPLFEVLGVLDYFVLHTGEGSLAKQVMHGGTTATANFNVTAALATITFGAIIVAGSMAHGFVKHWKNLVPGGISKFVYPILIPIEVMGMFVRPFALTMRLAANMTGGHIAILAILSFVFLFTELFGRAIAGIGVGLVVSIPLAVGISTLEILVVLIQAYVFTLLSAVFIGMAIHVHH
jgi:F-type H+-transporting ATPase subunit a